MKALEIIELVKIVVISLTVLVCVVTDFRTRKIYNKVLIVSLSLIVILTGIRFIIHPETEIWMALLKGMGLAFLLFFPLFATRIMGAGDVKLLMVIGAAMGPEFALNVAAWSCILAALFALVIIIFKKEIVDFLMLVWDMIVQLWRALIYRTKPCFEKKGTRQPFAFLMGLALVLTITGNYVF